MLADFDSERKRGAKRIEFLESKFELSMFGLFFHPPFEVPAQAGGAGRIKLIKAGLIESN